MNGKRFFYAWLVLTVVSVPFAASAAPPNDHFAGAALLEGRSGEVEGTSEGATREAGEPMIDGYEGGRSVWWRWTAPATEDVTVHTFGSDFDTILGVYTGTAVNALQLVAENDDPDVGDGLHSVAVFSAVAGRVYHFAVDGVYLEDGPGAESGDIVLGWISGSPANDDFDAGLVLEGPSGRAVGVNLGATREPGEPMIDSNDGGASVWWRWTAPQSGTVTVHTFGSNFDTLLGVYTGTAVGALTLVAENDDAGVGGGGGVPKRPAPCRPPRPGCGPPPSTSSQSRVDFEATAGTLYHFAVDGYDGESGNIMLTWVPASAGTPGNDPFAARIRLEGPEGFVLGRNEGATREAGEPDHAGSGGSASVWWSWVAPGDGTGEIGTFGSTFDTVLSVYTGTSVDGLVLVVENDDDEATGDVASFVRFRITAGTEYQIAVDGYDGESGIVALGWSFTPGVENPQFIRGDCDSNGNVNISDAVCALGWLFQGEAEPECIAATNSDGMGGVDLTDPIYLLTYLFLGGSQPVEPFIGCGPGTETDAQIGCWMPPAGCR
jgi:hypothetical protein